jgi:hypothetical protein
MKALPKCIDELSYHLLLIITFLCATGSRDKKRDSWRVFAFIGDLAKSSCGWLPVWLHHKIGKKEKTLGHRKGSLQKIEPNNNALHLPLTPYTYCSLCNTHCKSTNLFLIGLEIWHDSLQLIIMWEFVPSINRAVMGVSGLINYRTCKNWGLIQSSEPLWWLMILLLLASLWW